VAALPTLWKSGMTLRNYLRGYLRRRITTPPEVLGKPTDLDRESETAGPGIGATMATFCDFPEKRMHCRLVRRSVSCFVASCPDPACD